MAKTDLKDAYFLLIDPDHQSSFSFEGSNSFTASCLGYPVPIEHIYKANEIRSGILEGEGYVVD